MTAPTHETNCPFCRIARGVEATGHHVYADDFAVAFFPDEPATLGHTLVIPRRHVSDIWHLDDDTAEHLARLTLELSRAIEKALQPDGLNIIQSNGAAASQSVFHVHVHVVPRWSSDAMGPIWPLKSPRLTDTKKDRTLRLIQSQLVHGAD